MGFAGLLTALCFVDAARFVGVGSVAAADRLEQVLRDTHTRPLVAAEVAGGVRDRFAVLQADGGLTVVDRDQMTVSANGDVPVTPGRELMLIVDERCTVGQLRALLGRFPTEYGVGLGRVVRGKLRGSAGALRAARTTLAWSPFIPAETSLLGWPDARSIDLARASASASVRGLPLGEPLRYGRTPVGRNGAHVVWRPAPRTWAWLLFALW